MARAFAWRNHDGTIGGDTAMNADVAGDSDIAALATAHGALAGIATENGRRAALFWLVDKLGYPRAAAVLLTETTRANPEETR